MNDWNPLFAGTPPIRAVGGGEVSAAHAPSMPSRRPISDTSGGGGGGTALPPLSSPRGVTAVGMAAGGGRRGVGGLDGGVVMSTDAFIPGQFRRLSVVPSSSLPPRPSIFVGSPTGASSSLSPQHNSPHVGVPRGGGMGGKYGGKSGGGKYGGNKGSVGAVDADNRRRASVLATVVPPL